MSPAWGCTAAEHSSWLYFRGQGLFGRSRFRKVMPLRSWKLTQQAKREKAGWHDQEGEQSGMIELRASKPELVTGAPHDPAGNLCGHHTPHGNVKPCFLAALIACGAARPRRPIQQRCHHHQGSQQVIELDVEGADDPSAHGSIDQQASEIECDRTQQVNPCRCVTDHAIPEVRLVLTIVSDVGTRLDARQAAHKTTPGANDGDDGQPRPVAAVRTMGVEVGGEMSGQNPEGPYPEGHMQNPVINLVACTLDRWFHRWLMLSRF